MKKYNFNRDFFNLNWNSVCRDYFKLIKNIKYKMLLAMVIQIFINCAFQKGVSILNVVSCL